MRCMARNVHREGLRCQRLPGLFAKHVQAWRDYCTQVERSVRGDDETSTIPTVFGVCRRCGSTRLSVTTRQLRRADEGMPSGSMDASIDPTVNDGGAAVQGLWACNQGQQLTRHKT